MKENYYNYLLLPTYWFLRLMGLCLACTFTFSLSSQNECLIRSELEPDIQTLTLPLGLITENMQTSDGGLTLEEDKEFLIQPIDSNSILEISISDLGIHLPEGSIVHGLGLSMVGFQSGFDNLTVTEIQLLSNGEKIGENKAGLNVYGQELPDESTFWQYGHGTDKWDTELTPKVLNDTGFSIRFQLENTTDTVGIFYLDQVKLEVYFTELFTICEHNCAVFYTDPLPLYDYEWTLPDDVKLNTESSLSHIVNLDFTDLAPGVYSLCLDIKQGSSIVEQCCREIRKSTCGDFEISGKIVEDVNRNSIKDSMDVELQGQHISLLDVFGNIVADTITDNKGSYSFAIDHPDFYYVSYEPAAGFVSSAYQISSPEEDFDGYFLNNRIRSAVFYAKPDAALTNVDFGLISQFSISGKILEDLTGTLDTNYIESVTGIELELESLESGEISSIFSDENGCFRFEGLQEGHYDINVIFPMNFNFSLNYEIDILDSISVNGVNDEVEIDIFIVSYASITGTLWEDHNRDGVRQVDEPGFSGETITLLTETDEVVSVSVSELDGIYIIDSLYPGVYKVQFPSINSFLFTDFNNSIQNGSDAIEQSGTSVEYKLSSGQVRSQIDAGYVKNLNNISGFVWLDEDLDNLQGPLEPGLGDIQINLLDENFEIIQFQWTNGEGRYQFSNLEDGSYYISVAENPNYILAETIIDQTDINSDLNQNGLSNVVILDGDEAPESIDIGLQSCFTAVGDFVWEDQNGNGLQDEGEPGIEGVEVLLIRNAQIAAQAISDSDGAYKFLSVDPGTYLIQYTYDEIYSITIKVEDDQLNSDASFEENEGSVNVSRTDFFVIDSCEQNLAIDLGLIKEEPKSRIGNYVWNDFNQDGIQDGNEEGIDGISVILYDFEGSVIDSTISGIDPVSGQSGFYQFEGTYEGSFFLQFALPDQYSFSPNVAGETLNSDVTNSILPGSTDAFEVSLGEDKDDIDAGLFQPIVETSTIGDFIWFDQDQNSLQDEGEKGLEGVLVTLFNTQDEIIEQTVSDEYGFYSFDALVQGNYYLAFDMVEGLMFTPQLADLLDLNSDVNEMGVTDVISITPGEIRNDIDCGFISTTFLGDYVWDDANKNGIQDNEQGIGGLTVSLFSLDDQLIDQTITDANGAYGFFSVAPGNYYMQVEIPEGYQVSVANATNDLIDNDALSNGITANFTLGANENNSSIDFGLFKTVGLISGIVHHDHNLNHLMDQDETFWSDLVIDVLDEEGNIFHTIMTDKNGAFDLGILPLGIYKLRANIPDAYYISNQIGSSVKFNKSGISEEVSSNGQPIDGIAFGIYTMGTLKLGAWKDQNGNGVKELGEFNFKDIEAKVYNEQGLFVSRLDGDFLKLEPGEYWIRVPLQSGWKLTDVNVVASQEHLDSDFVNMGDYYQSTKIELLSEEVRNDLSIGFYKSGSIGSKVWLDENFDGMQDADEVGLVGVKVDLFDINQRLISSVLTNERGEYFFKDLQKGAFYLKFELPDPYEFTESHTLDVNLNSDVVNTFGYGSTDIQIVGAAENILNVDAGAILKDELFSDLMVFNGRRNEESNLLNWETKVHQPIVKYLLQRKRDGDREFISIAEIQAIDQEKSVQQYSYEDLDASEEGNYYYRLKEIDLQGNYTYSHTIAIKVLHHVITYEIYPNPVFDRLNVQFDVAEKSKVTITLHSNIGHLIERMIDYATYETGTYELQYNTSHLPKGIYILHITAGNRNYTQKILVEH